jgi:hypothetical protein
MAQVLYCWGNLMLLYVAIKSCHIWYICHIKSICFFVFFRALELPGPGLMMAELDSGLQRAAKACEWRQSWLPLSVTQPWERWSINVKLTPFLVKTCQNIVAFLKWSSPDSRFYTDWTLCSMDEIWDSLPQCCPARFGMVLSRGLSPLPWQNSWQWNTQGRWQLRIRQWLADPAPLTPNLSLCYALLPTSSDLSICFWCLDICITMIDNINIHITYILYIICIYIYYTYIIIHIYALPPSQKKNISQYD